MLCAGQMLGCRFCIAEPVMWWVSTGTLIGLRGKMFWNSLQYRIGLTGCFIVAWLTFIHAASGICHIITVKYCFSVDVVVELGAERM